MCIYIYIYMILGYLWFSRKTNPNYIQEEGRLKFGESFLPLNPESSFHNLRTGSHLLQTLVTGDAEQTIHIYHHARPNTPDDRTTFLRHTIHLAPISSIQRHDECCMNERGVSTFYKSSQPTRYMTTVTLQGTY